MVSAWSTIPPHQPITKFVFLLFSYQLKTDRGETIFLTNGVSVTLSIQDSTTTQTKNCPINFNGNTGVPRTSCNSLRILSFICYLFFILLFLIEKGGGSDFSFELLFEVGEEPDSTCLTQ